MTPLICLEFLASGFVLLGVIEACSLWTQERREQRSRALRCETDRHAAQQKRA